MGFQIIFILLLLTNIVMESFKPAWIKIYKTMMKSPVHLKIVLQFWRIKKAYSKIQFFGYLIENKIFV